MEEREVELTDYIIVILKHWRLIVVGAVLCVVSALTYSITHETHKTKYQTMISVKWPDDSSDPKPHQAPDVINDPVFRAYLLNTHFSGGLLIDILKADDLATGFGILDRMISVEGKTLDAITISVEDSSAALAKTMADSIPHLLQRFIVEESEQKMQERSSYLAQRIHEIEAEMSAAYREWDSFRESNRQLPGGMSLTDTKLRTRYLTLSGLYSTLLDSFERMRADTRKEFPEIHILSKPKERQDVSKTPRNAALAAAVGLMLSIFMAFFIEYMKKALPVLREGLKNKERRLA